MVESLDQFPFLAVRGGGWLGYHQATWAGRRPRGFGKEEHNLKRELNEAYHASRLANI